MTDDHRTLSRRALLAGAAALGGACPAIRCPRPAPRGSVTAAIYPGAWEEAYRDHVAPALKSTHNIELEMQPLFAVDQIAKVAASRGVPPFDCFVLDPGPAAPRQERGMFETFDASKLTNRAADPGRADRRVGRRLQRAGRRHRLQPEEDAEAQGLGRPVQGALGRRASASPASRPPSAPSA